MGTTMTFAYELQHSIFQICVLVQSIHGLGIELNLFAEMPVAQKLLVLA
jgi:hypothetical protein